MQLVEQHLIGKNHRLYRFCDEMSFKAKNLYNTSLYEFRQSYFNPDVKTLYWNEIDSKLKKENNIDYRELPAKVSQDVIRKLGKNINSYYKLLKAYNEKRIAHRPKLPKYLHKTNGRFLVEFARQSISKKYAEQNELVLFDRSYKIKLDTKVDIDSVDQIRIVPLKSIYKIEIVYSVVEEPIIDNKRYASIDLGLNNLATVVTNIDNRPLIINGRHLKSINQYTNKKSSKLKSLLPKGQYTSKSLDRLWLKRNNKLSYEFHKITKFLTTYFDERNISKVVIGNNTGWKNEINLGKRNNQNFVNISYKMFIGQLTYKCKLVGIEVVVREESYTSKASFLDDDNIPNYGDKNIPKFSGKRIKRGLYLSSSGKKINADVNGAYNILVKQFPNLIEDRWTLKYSPIKVA